MAGPFHKLPNLVGQFIRKRRAALGISQKKLGQSFNPPVTTQFISNVERGVTPLPPIHLETLIELLKVSDTEFRAVLEEEYSQRLQKKLSKEALEHSTTQTYMGVDPKIKAFFKNLETLYQKAPPSIQNLFLETCKKLFNLSYES